MHVISSKTSINDVRSHLTYKKDSIRSNCEKLTYKYKNRPLCFFFYLQLQFMCVIWEQKYVRTVKWRTLSVPLVQSVTCSVNKSCSIIYSNCFYMFKIASYKHLWHIFRIVKHNASIVGILYIYIYGMCASEFMKLISLLTYMH